MVCHLRIPVWKGSPVCPRSRNAVIMRPCFGIVIDPPFGRGGEPFAWLSLLFERIGVSIFDDGDPNQDPVAPERSIYGNNL
jgi:hypothetical protein